MLLGLAVMLLCGTASGYAYGARGGEASAEALSVSYTVRFDGGGASGAMAPLAVTLKYGEDVVTTLPPCSFKREGYRFAGWKTALPASTFLEAVILPDGQELTNLAWPLADLPEGWQGPMTLPSFADESNEITLVAQWADQLTGEPAGQRSPDPIRARTSSTTTQTIYLYNYGGHGFLSNGSWAPSGYWCNCALATVPTSSDTPVYCAQNPYEPVQWVFTRNAAEYNNLTEWVKKGVAFYSDDAQGIPIHRHYQRSSSIHTYSPDSWLSGYSAEGPCFYGIKYYEVRYDGGGATEGAMESQRHQYGLGYNLASLGFLKSDHHFIGWRGSDGRTYSDGQHVMNLTSQSGGIFTLTAQWAPDFFTVTYSSNGGEGPPVSERISNGSPCTMAPPSCTRPGFRFVGWSASSDGSGLNAGPGDEFMPTADTTLYAQWEPVQMEFSVPTVLPLDLHSDGSISAGGESPLSLENEGDEVIALEALSLEGASDEDSRIPWLDFSLRAPGGQVLTYGSLAEEGFKADTCDPLWWVRTSDALELDLADGRAQSVPTSVVFPWAVGSLRWQVALPALSLTYHPNGASGEALVQYGNVNEEVWIAPCPFSGSGEFAGWNTQADGEGVWVQPGKGLILEESMSLYAQWR